MSLLGALQPLLWLLAAGCCALLVRFWWARRRLRELAALVPGRRTLPLLGNTFNYLGTPLHTYDQLKIDMSLSGTFRVWLGPMLYMFITDPGDAQIVLGSSRILNRDGNMMKAFKPIFGEGLITSRDEKWRKHRRIIAPTFHTRILEQFVDIFNTQSEILVNTLENLADGNTFDGYSVLGLCTLDMICETAMGTQMNAQTSSKAPYLTAIQELVLLTFQRILRPWLMVDWLYNMTHSAVAQRNATKVLHTFADEVIAKKVQNYRENKLFRVEKNPEECSVGEKKRIAFLDMLIEASEDQGEHLQLEEMRHEVYTLIIAGQETTATASCSVLMMLGLHPEHQDQVSEELKDIFRDDMKRPASPEDLANMNYLERVIKETMRLLPPIFVLPREISEEVKLNTCTLPAGCSAMVLTWGLHRNPRHFPEPDKFDPDRFLPECVQGRHPYSYLPFGAGLRMCVGYKYALMQMKVTLSAVLRNYRVLPSCTWGDMKKQELGIVSKPVGGFPLRLLPRQWDSA